MIDPELANRPLTADDASRNADELRVVVSSVAGVQLTASAEAEQRGPKMPELGADHKEFLDIYTAARRGDAKELGLLMEGGADIDIRFTNANTPLIWACRMGLKDAAIMLLEAGADLEAKNEFGSTALGEAAEQGRQEVVAALIDAGANKLTQDQRHNTPLMLAARNGMVEAVGAILEQAKVQSEVEGEGEVDGPMMDLEQHDTEGYTAVMWAVLSGHIKAVRLLTAKGASIENVNANGVTVFGMAARMGQDAILKALLEVVVTAMTPEELEVNILRANKLLGITDKKQCSVLMWAVRAASAPSSGDGDDPKARAKECCRIILDGQAKQGGLDTLDSQNADGDTALIWAASAGQTDIVQYLLDKGADRLVKNAMNNTACDMAKELGHTGCEELCAPMSATKRERRQTLVTPLELEGGGGSVMGGASSP